jgi:hypothetical protein
MLVQPLMVWNQGYPVACQKEGEYALAHFLTRKLTSYYSSIMKTRSQLDSVRNHNQSETTQCRPKSSVWHLSAQNSSALLFRILFLLKQKKLLSIIISTGMTNNNGFEYG